MQESVVALKPTCTKKFFNVNVCMHRCENKVQGHILRFTLVYLLLCVEKKSSKLDFVRPTAVDGTPL